MRNSIPDAVSGALFRQVLCGQVEATSGREKAKLIASCLDECRCIVRQARFGDATLSERLKRADQYSHRDSNRDTAALVQKSLLAAAYAYAHFVASEYHFAQSETRFALSLDQELAPTVTAMNLHAFQMNHNMIRIERTKGATGTEVLASVGSLLERIRGSIITFEGSQDQQELTRAMSFQVTRELLKDPVRAIPTFSSLVARIELIPDSPQGVQLASRILRPWKQLHCGLSTNNLNDSLTALSDLLSCSDPIALSFIQDAVAAYDARSQVPVPREAHTR